MQIAHKAIMYGGVENIPPQELSKAQWGEVNKYRHEIRNELETAEQTNQGGGNSGSSAGGSSDNEPCGDNDTAGSGRGVKPLVAHFVGGVHEDDDCIIH